LICKLAYEEQYVQHRKYTEVEQTQNFR